MSKRRIIRIAGSSVSKTDDIIIYGLRNPLKLLELFQEACFPGTRRINVLDEQAMLIRVRPNEIDSENCCSVFKTTGNVSNKTVRSIEKMIGESSAVITFQNMPPPEPERNILCDCTSAVSVA